MIRILEERTFVEGKKFIGAAGLSTDTKPTELIANGSMCIEMDTGALFMFDAAGAEWKQINA